MTELYWITRLDGIWTTSVCFLSVCIIAFLFFIPLYVLAASDTDKKLAIKALKISVPVFIFSLLGILFIPTKQDILLILGVGGTIDYIQQNETAKQLPDKCINALDAWVESLNEK